MRTATASETSNTLQSIVNDERPQSSYTQKIPRNVNGTDSLLIPFREWHVMFYTTGICINTNSIASGMGRICTFVMGLVSNEVTIMEQACILFVCLEPLSL